MMSALCELHIQKQRVVRLVPCNADSSGERKCYRGRPFLSRTRFALPTGK
jgi:hypothetical protein